MTETSETTLPSQEITEKYVNSILIENKIGERLKIIGKRIDQAYKKSFNIDDSVNLFYSCYFKPGNKIIYKVSDGKGVEAFFPEIDVSCIWNETDLHIAINMMSSDFADEYAKIRNALRDAEKSKPLTLWQKIKRWL